MPTRLKSTLVFILVRAKSRRNNWPESLGAETANKHGIAIAAGHGLGYFNTQAICAIPGINELNIGHAIISRAIMVGMKQAVKDMIAVIAQGLANRKLS